MWHELFPNTIWCDGRLPGPPTEAPTMVCNEGHTGWLGFILGETTLYSVSLQPTTDRECPEARSCFTLHQQHMLPIHIFHSAVKKKGRSASYDYSEPPAFSKSLDKLIQSSRGAWRLAGITKGLQYIHPHWDSIARWIRSLWQGGPVCGVPAGPQAALWQIWHTVEAEAVWQLNTTHCLATLEVWMLK